MEVGARARLPAIVKFPVICVWLLVYVYRYILRVGLRVPPASLYCLHEFSSFPTVWFAARRAKAPLSYDCHNLYCRID
jgi:hypothetical protein